MISIELSKCFLSNRFSFSLFLIPHTPRNTKKLRTFGQSEFIMNCLEEDRAYEFFKNFG